MAQMPQIITVAEATADNPRHSEGSIVELAGGRLLLVWQEYTRSEKGGGDDAPNHLAAASSDDWGRTWSDRRVIVETDPGDVNVYSPSLLRLATGEILFFFFRYHVLQAGQPPSMSGFFRTSIDEGVTFSEPSPVWTRRPYGHASQVASQLSSSRIILPLGRQTGRIWSPDDHEVAGCLYSDDRGRTWTPSRNWVDLPLRGAMETHIAEASSGKLVMVVRTQLGAVFKSESADGGESWSKPRTTGLKSPESCPDIVRIPTTGDLMLVWNNSTYDPAWTSHYGKRTPLSVAVSPDEGVTWTNVRNIETDPTRAFTNPGTIFTSRGEAVINYWTCKYTTASDVGPTAGVAGRMNVSRIDLKLAILPFDWLCRPAGGP